MDEEKVEYSFTGDVSSLREATKSAIGLLDNYEGAIKRMASLDTFKASKTSVAAFQRTVNGVIKQVNSMQKFMQNSTTAMQQSMLPDASKIDSAVANIADALEYMQSISQVTTDDIKLMTMVLKETKDAMDGVTARAHALGASFESVAQMQEKAGNASEYVSGILSSANSKMLQNAPFVEYAKRADAGLDLANKSARESAQVFIQSGKLGMSGFYTGIDKTADKVIQMHSRINQVSASMRNKLASIGQVFDPIKSKLQSFKDTASGHFVYVSAAADQISRAFYRVVGALSADKDATDADNNSKKTLGGTLKSVLASLKSKTRATGETVKATLKSTFATNRATSSGSKFSKILKSLSSKLTAGVKRLSTFSSSMLSLHSVGNLVQRLFTKLVGVSFLEWVAKGIKGSMDFTENLNLFKVAMGSSVEQGYEFVATMSEIYGMDPSNLYKTAGYFYQLTDAIGMTDQASATLSLSLTKAANDISSLFNVDVQTVVDDLASGMQGMSRSVRKYGMDIRATTLEQTALSLGMQGSVETMSEANRMALRYITMMRQVTNATKQTIEGVDGSKEVIGDFARTINEPANQMRIFKEQMTQLARAIGNFFIPTVRKVMPVVNGLVMSIRMALTYIAAMTGALDDVGDTSSSAESSSSALDQITDSANEATAAVKKLTAPFDELNILSEQQSTSSTDLLDPALQQALESMELQLENIKMRANEIRDSILAFFGFTVEDGTITGWSKEVFLQGLDQLDKEAPKLAKKLAQKINKIVQKMSTTDLGKSFGSTISTAINTGVTFIDNLDFNALGVSIANFLTSGFGSIDYYNLGKLCASKFRIALDILDGIIKTMGEEVESYSSGWAQFGDNLAKWLAGGLDSIDWTKLGKATSDLVLGLFKLIITALSNTDWELVGKRIAEFINGLDFSKIFDALLKTFSLILKGLADAFASLWENADTETKSAIAAAGIVLLTSVISKVIGTVKNLTSAFKGKNDALTQQNKLEATAATSLSRDFIPALAGTAVTVGLAQEKLGSFNTALGNLNAQPAESFCSDVGQSFENMSDEVENSMGSLVVAPAVAAAGIIAFDATVSTSAWDASPIEEFCGRASNAFGELATAILSCVAAIVAYNNVSKPSELPQGITAPGGGVLPGVTGVLPDKYADLFPKKEESEDYALPPAALAALPGRSAFEQFLLLGLTSAFVGPLVEGFGLITEAIAGGFTFTFPQFIQPPYGNGNGNLAMATGGVVTSPTYALIGEGRYDEAVIPLGNSPQMRELVDEIADAVDRGPSDDTPVQVQVFIGNEQVADYMHRASRRRDLQTNGGT